MELAKLGVQIFITTHDYFIQQCFNMAAMYPKADSENLQYNFVSLYRTESGVEMESASRLTDLTHNAIMEEFDQLYDRGQGCYMNIEESNLTFVFPRDIIVSKFDDGKFYRKSFGKMPGSKGVDIIADSGDMLQLIEIKNCKGHEQENRWRTSVDNSKVTSAPATLDVKDRDSLDIEVAKRWRLR